MLAYAGCAHEFSDKPRTYAHDGRSHYSPSERAVVNAPKINASAQTVALWNNFEVIANRTRESDAKDGALELSQLQGLQFDGADPTIVSHIEATKSYLNQTIVGAAQAHAARANVPDAQLMRVLRPFAEQTGEELLPRILNSSADMDAALGALIGELCFDYVYNNSIDWAKMPDDQTVMLVMQTADRLLVEESLINKALGFEDSSSLRDWLGSVRDRAFAADLLRGNWVCRNVNGKVADLVFKSDRHSYHLACGALEMHWRIRGGPEVDSFTWQFVHGQFRMTEMGFGSILGFPQSWRSLKAGFVSEDEFHVADERGNPIGRWTRVGGG